MSPDKMNKSPVSISPDKINLDRLKSNIKKNIKIKIQKKKNIFDFINKEMD